MGHADVAPGTALQDMTALHGGACADQQESAADRILSKRALGHASVSNAVKSVRDKLRQQRANGRTTAAGEDTFVRGGGPSLSYKRLRYQALTRGVAC